MGWIHVFGLAYLDLAERSLLLLLSDLLSFLTANTSAGLSSSNGSGVQLSMCLVMT